MPTIAQQWKQEGREEGREEGRIAGQIQLLQKLLGHTESTLEELLAMDRRDLQGEIDRLRSELEQRVC
jgi:flagellar biosynthesis/type III secretory pathway protein FliH